jgi:hypothetical protein
VVAELTRNAARTAPALLPRRPLASQQLHYVHPSEGNLVRDIFTVVGFITVLSGAVVGLAFVLRIW